MFKSLKDQLATQVTKTNQSLYSTLFNDSASTSKDSSNRSRLDSAASDISQTANYISPSRQFVPPSDIESEHDGGEESDHETTSRTKVLLSTYKTKFNQLKKAYDEVEHERDRIKDVLQKYQDASLKRKEELREQIKSERQAREQVESNYHIEIKLRDEQIEKLRKDQEETQRLRTKTVRLEEVLLQCKAGIIIHQEKQAELIKERDDLLQKLTESSLATQNEQHPKLYNALKTDFENLINEFQQIKQAKDDIQSRLYQTGELQREHDEAVANCVRLEEILASQREEMTIFRVQQQAEFDKTLTELREEHQKNIERLKSEWKVQLSPREDELHTTMSSVEADLRQSLDEQKTSLIEEIENLQQQLIDQTKFQDEQTERYSQLEIQFNQLLTDKSTLENQFEQTIRELQTNQQEIEILKSEIVSLVNINEENTRRIDEYDDEKFHLAQEILEKDRQLIECHEQIQELQTILEQTKESNDKLRKALQKMKESIQTNSQEVDKEKNVSVEIRLKEQEMDYHAKLKAMAKEMSTQIDEKEQIYQRQLRDFIQNNHKTENELVSNSEQRVANAEQRAITAEQQMSKMDEQLKEKQLDHYRVVQDLQNQIRTLTKERTPTTECFSQTSTDDLYIDHSYLVEPIEVDYLKEIVLAYMKGTDPLTMVKVICAVLHYTDEETSLIVEHEKLRQSRWLNSPR